MTEVASLIGIAAAIAVGAASPGPSFLMVARTAAAQGRSGGLGAALGMGFGGLIFAVAALLGANAVFRAVPALYTGLKLAGGLYLAYLAVRIWRDAKQPLDVRAAGEPVPAGHRSSLLLLGLATQLSNPKAAIVYASVFAAFMPAKPSLEFDAAVVCVVFVIETGWYAIVAAALSAEAPRSTYLRYKKWIDRSAGGIMGALGLKLATSATAQ